MMLNGLSEVVDNLWIGGFPHAEDLTAFDKLILCAEEYQPDPSYFPGVHVLYVPLSSAMDMPEEAKAAVQAGRAVAGWLRRKKKVLVSCAMGLNRSALIATVALMTRGMTSSEAIEKVRAARGKLALHNPQYVTLLRRIEDARDFYVNMGI